MDRQAQSGWQRRLHLLNLHVAKQEEHRLRAMEKLQFALRKLNQAIEKAQSARSFLRERH